jgi:hypothetical protein
MPDSKKLKSLRRLRDKLQAGQIRPQEMDGVHVQDTDGTKVPLTDENALAALERRIALEEAQQQ